MNDVGQQILFANIAFSAAILIVLLLRKPVRAGFGARLAYALWLLPPLAVVAGLLPPRIVEIAVLASPASPDVLGLNNAFYDGAELPPSTSVRMDPALVAAIVWLAGALAMAIWLCARQLHFQTDMHAGKAGPAVVGFLRPRIVTPDDFEARFDARERRVILAHEAVHLRMHDARINAVAAFLRCICWYNPLIHIAAHCLRIDQEMACDASVVEHHPKARRVYADALLKAQLASRPLPLGCYWPPGAEHPLTERIEMLKQPAPGRFRRIAGAGVLSAIALSVGYVAWAVLPEERVVEIPYERPPASPAVAEPLPSQSARYLPPPGAQYDHNDHIVVRGFIERTFSTGDGLTASIRATEILRNGHTQPVTPGVLLWRADPAAWPDQRKTGEWTEPGAEIRVEGYVAKDKRCAPQCRLEWLRMHTGPQPTVAPRLKRASQPIKAAAAVPTTTPPAVSSPANAQSPAPPANSRPPAILVTSDLFDHDPLAGRATYSGNVEVRFNDLVLKADTIMAEGLDRPASSGGPILVDADLFERGPAAGVATYSGNVVVLIGQIVLKTEKLTVEGIDQAAAPSSSPLPQPTSYDEPQQTPAKPDARNDVKSKVDEDLAKKLGLLPGEKPGPAFASLFDAEAPILIKGPITKVELADPNSFVWVQSDKLYKVMGGRARLTPAWMKDPSVIGATIIVRGYLAKDKACNPDCLVNGRDVVFDSQKIYPAPDPFGAPTNSAPSPR